VRSELRAPEDPVCLQQQVGSVASGKTVSVTFPIVETTESKTVDGRTYSFVKRGNTVVNISTKTPEPSISPLYDRESMRTATAPMVSVTRFVSTEQDLPTRKAVTWKLPVVNVTASSSANAMTPDKMLDGDQDSASRWSSNGDGQSAVFELDRLYENDKTSAAPQTYDFPNARARYVRVVCRGSEGSTTNALTDVKIFGF
jgi:hypothetical protein